MQTSGPLERSLIRLSHVRNPTSITTNGRPSSTAGSSHIIEDVSHVSDSRQPRFYFGTFVGLRHEARCATTPPSCCRGQADARDYRSNRVLTQPPSGNARKFDRQCVLLQLHGRLTGHHQAADCSGHSIRIIAHC